MRLTTQNAEYMRRFDIHPRVPSSGKWVRVLHDHEIGDLRYKNLAYPSTRRFRVLPEYPDFIPMPAAAQWWWFGLLKFVSGLPDSTVRFIWERITSNHVAFTDNNSRDNGYRDYVLGVNENAEPFRLASLTTTGNILEVLASEGNYYMVRAMDFSRLPTYADALKTPGLIHWASEARNTTVSNFPDFENVFGVPFGVPVPNPSMSGNQYIHKDFCEVMANGSEYEIYTGK